MEWRKLSNRWHLSDLWKKTDEVGIVPAEFDCVVVDVDMKHGVNGKKNLFDKFDKLPESLHYTTRSGGFHLWYRVPKGSNIPQRNGKIEGIDIRYDRGYVCLDKYYKFKHSDGIVDCPDYFLNWLEEPSFSVAGKARYDDRKASRGYGGVYDFSPFRRGQRNNECYAWGYGLLQGVKSGQLSKKDLYDMLMLRGHTYSGLPRTEVELIFNSLLTNL